MIMINPIIAFANNKGGATKTESCKRIGIQLASMGYRPTLVDNDPQANLTRRCGGISDHRHIGNVLGGAVPATSRFCQAAQVVEIEAGTAYLVAAPADLALENIAIGLQQRNFGRLTALADAIEADRAYLTGPVLIDTQPNIAILTLNALVAADYVIIPAEPEPDSIEGVRTISKIIEEIRRERGRAPAILGVIATRVDGQLTRHRDGLKRLVMPDMPRLLGVVPARSGADADARLNEAYAPIARLIAGLLSLEVGDAQSLNG